METRTVAVAGASGFLGRHLCAAIEGTGVRILPLLRDGENPVDYGDVSSLAKRLETADAVVHAAGLTNGSREQLEEANLRCTRALLEAAGLAGAPRFVYVSSAAAAVGDGAYARVKREAEKSVRASALPGVILRPTMIYGPGDRNNLGWMKLAVRFCPVVPVLGGGAFEIQPVFVDDVTAAVVQALVRNPLEAVYLVAGPSRVSLARMLRLLATAMKRRRLFLSLPLGPVQAAARLYRRLVPGTRLPVKQLLGLHRHAPFDIEPARRDLGFDPVDFEAGLRLTAAREGW